MIASLEQVVHDWRDTRALAGLDLRIGEGELVCLVGPSGCGKSTILSLLVGLATPARGRVTFRGAEVRGPGTERALVFQDGALFPWLDVAANVAYPMRVRGVPRKEREARTSDLLRRVHLFAAKDKYPHELSGGMQQRAAIARALACDPELLAMDEPFSALDTETRARLGDEVLRLWREEKKTIVFVTHDPLEAVRLGDRVIVLSGRPGRVVREIAIGAARPRSIDHPEVAALVREVQREIAAQTARAREEDEDAYARAERARDSGRAAFLGSGI